MTTFKFPETNLVKCVFSLRTNSKYPDVVYDEFDRFNVSDFKDIKSYVYRVPDCLKGQIKVGDFVVVHCSTGYQLCEVIQVNVTSSFDEASHAPVVCKVDLGTYFEEVKAKQAREQLARKLESMAEQLKNMVTYELLAEKNPKFKELLDQYKELGGTL